jgi:uncharacterized damage-inducible protein DinB
LIVMVCRRYAPSVLGLGARSDGLAGCARLAAMTPTDAKGTLQRYLQTHRDVMLWKLDGLSEYDVRRPLTPTGTNLLGLVKHLAMVEAGYFGDVFGRPLDGRPAWFEDQTPNVDMWATAEQSREEIVALYRRVWQHADGTIEALPLDAPGTVPWWGDRGSVTLHQILVHVIAETARHAGHADIVREFIDGAAGLRESNDNLWLAEDQTWAAYRQRLQEVAESFR